MIHTREWCAVEETARAANYPLSRWYLRPAAGSLATALAETRARPSHLTILGMLTAVAAGASLVTQPHGSILAAALVLAAWFFDRADGQLARRQRTTSARGAWLDANIDELVDVGLHIAAAQAAAMATGSDWPWMALVAFLVGKYLFMYGLAEEDRFADQARTRGSFRAAPSGLLKRLYHLPANADVRIHLLAAAAATGWLAAELALVAAYYNFRWLARYVLVCRRLSGEAP